MDVPSATEHPILAELIDTGEEGRSVHQTLVISRDRGVIVFFTQTQVRF